MSRTQTANPRTLPRRCTWPVAVCCALVAALIASEKSRAQVTLTETNYFQNFNSLGSGLPTGWTTRTNVSSNSLGSALTFSNTNRTAVVNGWSNTTAAFKNYASATGLTNTNTFAQQTNSTDRALGIRPTGSFGDDAGNFAGFALQLSNTLGFDSFTLSMDAMLLAAEGRTNIWTLDYGVGASPASFTTLTNWTTPTSFGITTLSISSDTLAGIANLSSNVWIRFSILSLSTGSGSRDSVGIDNFSLSYSALAAAFNWTGSSGNWTNGFGSAPTNGSALTFSSAGGGAATNDLAALTVASIAFNNGAGSFTNSGNAFTISNGIINNATTVQVFSNAITLGAAQTFNAASGALTFAGDIANGGNLLTLTVASNAALSGIVSGDGGLTKSGAGTATISGANTFSGAVTVSAGALRATDGSALGTTTTGTTVSSGAALELSGGITISGEALSLSGTGISSGGALRNISGDNTYGGAITLGAATRISSDAGTLTLDVASGNAITGTQNLTIGGAGNITVNDAIATGTGALTKEGAGTLLLAGSNTFTGAVVHNEGRIVLTNGNALADTVAVTLANTASVILEVDSNEAIGSLSGGGTNGGTVALDTNSLTLNQSGNTSFTGDVSGSGALIKSGAGTLTLNRTTAIGPDLTLRINQGTVELDRGGNSLFGMLGANNAVELGGGMLEFTSNAGDETGVNAKSFSLLSASTILINRTGASAGHTTTMSTPFSFTDGATLTLDYAGVTAHKATTTYSGANTLNSDATIRVQNSAGGTAEVIFSGAFSDGGSGFGLTKLGSQTMTLSAANTYTGDTVVGQGTLQLSGSGRIADGSRVVVSNGATMNFNSISDTIEGFSGAGSVSLGSATLTLSNIATDTFSGAISGTGSIVKRGAGTQVLSGANTYSGATTIGGGTLRIDGNARLGNTNTALTISNAGILEVTAAGTLTNAITIGAGNGVLSNSSGGGLVIAGAVSKNGTVLTSSSGSGTNVFTGVISGASANSDFIVDGGTTVFSNVMTYNGPTIITNGGTLVLSVDDAMPSGSDLILGGGTFRVGVLNYNADSTLSMGALTLSADSTIDLGNFGTNGDRNLVFANSSTINWTPGAILTITNWQGVAFAQSDLTKLMFGTGGLDSDQMAQISFADQGINGGTLINGELAPIPEARIIWAALALTLLIIWRERRRWMPLTSASRRTFRDWSKTSGISHAE